MAEPRMSYGERNFGGGELGDERRSRRLPKLVDEMCRHPGGSLPQKLSHQKDLDSFYRLCEAEDVTHAAVIEPHRQKTLQYLQTSEDFVLAISDATELDYTTHHTVAESLGQIGRGTRRGLIAQNTLVVDPSQGIVVGLANQILHVRPRVSKKETQVQSRQRNSRESRLWMRGTQGLPARREVVGVYDRGADTFEFLEHETRSGRTFVIRSTHDRCITLGHQPQVVDKDSTASYLHQHARSLPAGGHCELAVEQKHKSTQAKRKGKRRQWIRTKRIAQLSVASAAVQIQPSTRRRGEFTNQPLCVWIVRIWEPQTPEGEEPLEWLLITNHPVQTPEEALLIKTWYEWRWIIEELHKAMKTGCAIEDLQFQHADRLEPAIGIISILALTLLALRDAGRNPQAKTRLANEQFDDEYIQVLSLWCHGDCCPTWTQYEFYMALAKLGGHPGYKSRRPPGWIVLWRGWEKLQLMVLGARVAKRQSKIRSENQEKCA
jgi:hypothetical protein